MCRDGWCIGFDPESEAEAQLRAEGKWGWDDPADLGTMYTDGPEWRGPDLPEPIYDEFAQWVEDTKEGWFGRWLRKFKK